MKKFFSDKKNLIFVIVLAVALIVLGVSTLVEALIPFACILCGVVCFYVSYFFFLRYLKKKRNKVNEFISEEDEFKKKKNKFLEVEGRSNLVLTTGMFVIMGLFLVYYGVKMFTV